MYRRFLLPGVAALFVGLLGLFSYLHRADLAVLSPHGPVALQERSVIVLTLLLCAIVVVPVFVLLGVFSWKYRADRPTSSDEHAPDWDKDSWVREVVWWLVPTIIIILLSILAWRTSHQLDPYKPLASAQAPIEIDVVALNWKWLFIYPEQRIATVNMLAFPENTPIHFYITADAPMNGFWIPSLGGQMMAMPGMSTQLNVLASATGTYQGFSSQISGDGFSGMHFTAHSVTKADFDAWITSVQGQSNPLTLASYASLAHPSINLPSLYFSPVEDHLYATIVGTYMQMGQAQGAMHMQ